MEAGLKTACRFTSSAWAEHGKNWAQCSLSVWQWEEIQKVLHQMKAICLTQPWASLVVCGLKNWETRSWHTNHLGDLLICAGADSTSPLSQQGRQLYESDKVIKLMVKYGVLPMFFAELPRGQALGVVTLHDCRPTVDVAAHLKEPYGDFSPGRYAWLLTVKKRFKKPFPVIGRQRFFNVETCSLEFK